MNWWLLFWYTIFILVSALRLKVVFGGIIYQSFFLTFIGHSRWWNSLTQNLLRCTWWLINQIHITLRSCNLLKCLVIGDLNGLGRLFELFFLAFIIKAIPSLVSGFLSSRLGLVFKSFIFILISTIIIDSRLMLDGTNFFRHFLLRLSYFALSSLLNTRILDGYILLRFAFLSLLLLTNPCSSRWLADRILLLNLGNPLIFLRIS